VTTDSAVAPAGASGASDASDGRGAVPGAAVRRARWATSLVFATHGAVTGSFAARVPAIASHVGVSVGQLSLALLTPGLGAMVAMPFCGRLVHRFAFRPLMTVTLAAWCAALVLPSLPTTLWLLCLALLVYGAAAGLPDNVMNAQAVLLESRYGRSIMSSFHGFWSVGVLAGSGFAALSTRLGVDTRVEFGLTAAGLIAVGGLSCRWLLAAPPPAEDVGKPPAFALPSRPVLLIGLVGLCAVFGEQSSGDWAALYIHRQLGGSLSLAALTVSAFALAMAATRLLGDHLIRRLGPVRTVRVAGTCAGAGALLVVFAHDVAVGVAGFALLGVGVAVVVPLVFAAAGRVGPHPGRSIAGVAGVSYGAGLVAPGVIGGVATASSLRVSFAVVAGLVVLMGLAAGVLRPPSGRT
jgi:MFS family permease